MSDAVQKHPSLSLVRWETVQKHGLAHAIEQAQGDGGGQTRDTRHARQRSKGEANQAEPNSMRLEDVRQLVNAVAFAHYLGTPMLVMVTVRWDLMDGFEFTRWTEMQTTIFERIGKWLARADLPLVYAWVREVSPAGAAHTHVLMHLPRRYWSDFRAFLAESGGFHIEAQDAPIHLQGGRFGTYDRRMQAGALRYMLKGLPPDLTMRADDGRLTTVCRALRLKAPQHVPTPVPGRHVGVSHAVGPTARAARGWRELRGDKQLRWVLHP